MTDIALTLGPVEFSEFEIPASINFGGRQILAVHQLIGGRRVIDSIGPSASEMKFSGTFSGPTAAARSQMIDLLRGTGRPLSLAWNAFLYEVVVDEFIADYRSPTWIPYRISCTVVRDNSPTTVSSPVSLSGLILADIASASDQCAGTNAVLGAAQSALQVPNCDTLGSAAYIAAQTTMTIAQSGIASELNMAETALTTMASLTGTSTAAYGTDFLATVAATQQLAQMVSASGYIGRAARNLSNASS